ncbi:Hypothetical predicted protein [Lecanosticta acicola]|uniref:DUF4211 domain-containing protein n=1 Tax=Lecanosticta acicola TaxID=111012 RepID=A0AAI9EBR7_9PEZI|nr:Hypothetical predicted protein [Lecanosticta acicola]
MPSSKRSRKRQSRLAFTPLPSSSPATKGYNKQIRDRAANVSLEGVLSSAKRRKVIHDDYDDDDDVESPDELATMPTPATSLEKPASKESEDEEDSDDQPIRSAQRRPMQPPTRKSRSKQKQLDFNSARDPDSFDSPVQLASSSPRRTRSTKGGIFSSQVQGPIVDISSDESDASAASDDLPSPGTVLTRSKKAEKVKEQEQRGTRSSKVPAAEEEDDSDEITVGMRRPRPQQVQEESDDDEDEMPTTMGTQRRKRKRARSRDSFINDSPPQALDTDSDLEIVPPPSRKRRRQASESDRAEDDDDDEPKTPTRRRLKKQPRQLSKQEQEDLAGDLDFLGPSSDAEESARNPRSSQSAAKNARQQALDRLKQKRSGKLPQVEEEDEEQEDAIDEEDDVQELSDEVEEVAAYTSSRQFFKEDDEDADFLVDGEDDEGPLGVPTGIPIEFTRYASMKGKDLFKYAVDWMVQRKINPGFQKDDQLYNLAFKKLDDEVRGLAGSKFTSSAWTPEFTVALQSRPEIAFSPIDRTAAEHFMRDKCDACNRSGHPATFEIQFQGLPYDPSTLEELDHDDDDDDEDSDDASDGDGSTKHNDDEPDWDQQGREIVPINTIFYVGRFCKLNAHTAHSLQHWKMALKEFVEGWLIKMGYTNSAELEKRDRWKTKKKRKYANKIVDYMEKSGEMKILWRKFKANIDEAREAKQGRFEAVSP